GGVEKMPTGDLAAARAWPFPRAAGKPSHPATTGRSRQAMGKALRPATGPEQPCPPDHSDRGLVHVAPAPRLPGLERAHDRMLRRPEVRRRVPVLRGIAAADEAARQADPEIAPARPAPPPAPPPATPRPPPPPLP